MINYMSWDQIQEILLTLTPIAAVFIALSGLNTWKHQLKGTHDFELSRRLLLAIYKCRDALKAARSPFVQPSEASKGRDDWETSAYENRWKQVDEAIRELKASILESEASWGEDFKEEHDALHKLVVSLMLATRHYLSSNDKRQNNRLFNEKDKKVLWGTDDDDYSSELEMTVKKFEEKIKPRLGRK